MEYAWYSDIRLSFISESDKWIMPWKISSDSYTDPEEDTEGGQLVELKKHTTDSFDHIKTSIGTLSKSYN